MAAGAGVLHPAAVTNPTSARKTKTGRLNAMVIGRSYTKPGPSRCSLALDLVSRTRSVLEPGRGRMLPEMALSHVHVSELEVSGQGRAACRFERGNGAWRQRSRSWRWSLSLAACRPPTRACGRSTTRRSSSSRSVTDSSRPRRGSIISACRASGSTTADRVPSSGRTAWSSPITTSPSGSCRRPRRRSTTT